MARRKKNRIVSVKTSSSAKYASGVLALIFLLTIGAVIYVLSLTTNTSLSSSIGKKERELRALEEEYCRENARLASLMTPERLSRVLRKRGMAMNVAQPHQIIKMTSSGRPYPGQMALRRLSSSATGTAFYRGKR